MIQLLEHLVVAFGGSGFGGEILVWEESVSLGRAEALGKEWCGEEIGSVNKEERERGDRKRKEKKETYGVDGIVLEGVVIVGWSESRRCTAGREGLARI